jgi:hypothetical protein
MSRLPFVVEPRRQPIIERIGSEDSGIIEIERRGYLTTGEKAFVQQVQQVAGGTSEIITLSRRIARKHKLSIDRAYGLVMALLSGEQQDDELLLDIEDEFAEELASVIKGLSADQTREDLVYAACMLRYRVDPDFEIGEVGKIHPDIIAGLVALYRDEESKSLKAFIDVDELTAEHVSVEETEKKSSKATKSHSKTTTTD